MKSENTFVAIFNFHRPRKSKVTITNDLFRCAHHSQLLFLEKRKLYIISFCDHEIEGEEKKKRQN